MGDIISKLYIHTPRYGPEWGSGGIYGLRYHRGVLYYTLAFEARSFFIREDGVKEYMFDLVGKPPVSGGDTYNAVDAVDDMIFFGGWVHAPANYIVKQGVGRIDSSNKYSHVHLYRISDDRIELLWKEGVYGKGKWVGEVSEIIYDPVNDRLLIACGDSMVNLDTYAPGYCSWVNTGIYALDYHSKRITKLSSKPVLKGTLVKDHACFDVHESRFGGIKSIQCIDLVSNDIDEPITLKSDGKIGGNSVVVIDNGVVNTPLTGVMSYSYGNLFVFVRGGLYVGNPVTREEPMYFIRLFDFNTSGYGPLRTKAVNIGGGILVAYNSFTHGVQKPSSMFEKEIKRSLNTIVGPSVLVYITPPIARIVGVFGARITSIEKIGDKILLGTNNDANYLWYNATPNDTGTKSFVVLNDTVLTSNSPPLAYGVPGWMIEDKHWGGIPLYGYKNPRLVLTTSKDNELEIYEYDLSIPPRKAVQDKLKIKKGRNIIELDPWRGSIVSFKLRNKDAKLYAKIVLE